MQEEAEGVERFIRTLGLILGGNEGKRSNNRKGGGDTRFDKLPVHTH